MYPKGYLSPVLRHPKEKHTHTDIHYIYKYIYNIYIYIKYKYKYIYIPYIRIGVPFLRHRRLLGALGMALSRQRSRVKCYAPTMRTTSSLMQVFG